MSRLRDAVALLVLILVISSYSSAQSGGPIVYVYDELGRLVAVTDPNADTVRYSYDAVGNLLSVSRYSSTQLSIIRFDPGSGPVNSSVTISGTGFSSTPSQDTVQFNGIAASVTSATATQLTVTVPNGATTGPITASTAAGSVTSTNSFTVTGAAPAITGFSPSIAVAGTTINISGSNFDPLPANDSVNVNATSAVVTSASSTAVAATVPAATSSGHISLSTAFGKAVTSNYLFIPPSPYAVTDVQYTGQTTIGTQATVTISTSAKIGLLVFDATAGQIVSAEVAGFGGGFFTATLVAPDGSIVASTMATNVVTFTGKRLALTGTYTVLIAPSSGVTGSATVSLTSQNTDDTITFNNPVTKTISVTSQIGLKFSGISGQVISTEATGFAGGMFTMTLLNPDGSTLATSISSSAVSLVGQKLPFTGVYTILIMPNNGVSGTVTVSLVSQTTNSTINFNTPVTNTISSSSLIGLSFSGTAGQVVTAEAAGLNGVFTLYVLNPNGTTLGSTVNSGALKLVGLTLATTGTYQIVIAPNNGVSGTVTVSLVSQTTNSTINFNTPATNTISSSSLMGLSFSGTAGQVVTAEAAGLNGVFTLYVLNPNGTTLGLTVNSGALKLVGLTLATTGTYQVVIAPNNGVSGTVTVSLVSQTTNSTINFNTPVTNTISSSSLMGLSFSGTAGQVVTAEAAGLNGVFTLYVLNPNGTTLGSTVNSGALKLVGLTLATTGTYQIVIAPNNGVTGTVTASLVSQTSNSTINFNTPVTNTISSSSLIGLSFSGTAGQVVTAEAAGLNGAFTLSLLNPNGTTLQSTVNSGTLKLVGLTLGSTGTYQIVIAPNNGVSGTVTASLVSQTTNSTINFNTPVTNTCSSSLIGLSFSGTANQTISVHITPSFSGGGFWAYLLNPNGTTLTSTFSTGAVSFNGQTLGSTGTYQIVIAPNSGVTGSATTSLTSP